MKEYVSPLRKACLEAARAVARWEVETFAPHQGPYADTTVEGMAERIEEVMDEAFGQMIMRIRGSDIPLVDEEVKKAIKEMSNNLERNLQVHRPGMTIKYRNGAYAELADGKTVEVSHTFSWENGVARYITSYLADGTEIKVSPAPELDFLQRSVSEPTIIGDIRG